MDRRIFLKKSTFYLFGNFLGFGFAAKAFGRQTGPGTSEFRPRLSLIIDDIGYSVSVARLFLQSGLPITFAVLPHLLHSQGIAVEMRDRGQEVMLHQPMEPYDGHFDPGPGALYVGDDSEKIVRIMADNISAVPFAAGVNNHMGSKFTACQQDIGIALQVVKNTGLFFVDSLTTCRSKAYRTARNLNISSACRNIFLDNVQDEGVIFNQLERLKKHALSCGRGIGIGHPYEETARAINRFVSEAFHDDISFVHASSLLSG